MQHRQQLLDYYQTKALEGVTLTIQQAFRNRESYRQKIERELYDKNLIRIIYTDWHAGQEYPEGGFSDKVWFHTAKAMRHGPSALVGYPYGNGYGTMELWQFLLEEGAVTHNVKTDSVGIHVGHYGRLPYGLNAYQNARMRRNGMLEMVPHLNGTLQPEVEPSGSPRTTPIVDTVMGGTTHR